MNIQGFKATVSSNLNEIGKKAYSGAKVLKNAVCIKDSVHFSSSKEGIKNGFQQLMKNTKKYIKKYAPKVKEKAEQDFAKSKNIKTKTFLGLALGVTALSAAVVNFFGGSK